MDGDIEALGLTDNRISYVDPGDFQADFLVDEFQRLRPDATWHLMELPAQDARYRDVDRPLAPAVVEALRRTGRDRLYTHQADAVSAALRGENVIQATAAGSGKSLGFVLPTLNSLVRDPSATALFVFPLRALANDQMEGLTRFGIGEPAWANGTSFDLQLTGDGPPIRVARYDGSTPEHERPAARRTARLMIATPDMVHQSLLRMAHRTYKDGSSWRQFLRGLRYIVCDEVHAYQGVFGSAVANVLRRLRRAAHLHGSDPRVLAASATIGNPVELAERLTGLQPFRLVEDDGSARQRRVVLVCNPPERRSSTALKAQATKKDENAELDAGRIAPQTVAIEMIANGALASESHAPVRTIAFCQSRSAVFQLAKRVEGSLREGKRSDLVSTVAPYAATFLAKDRVNEEGRLRDGSTLAVISTSALELGIDIPELSLAVLVGYPGRVASFRQRAGRVGRSGEGLAVLIVGDDPLQQYLARDPDGFRRLLDARAEDVVVNPDAPEIVRRFGLAPAQEEFGGIAFEDSAYFGTAVEAWLEDAKGPPDKEVGGSAYWAVPSGEEPYADLRTSTGNRSFRVLAQSGRDNEPIGIIDEASAPRDAFVPAIWTAPGGELYRVIGFDRDEKEVYCEGPLDLGYQTRGVVVDRVEVAGNHRPPMIRSAATIGYGVLRISRQVFNYREQHFSGIERSQPVERAWPPIDFVTDGMFIQCPDSWFSGDLERTAALRAVEHVVLSVAPALVACDPYDLDAGSDRQGIYLYDAFGGQLRLSEVLFDRLDELLGMVEEVVGTCPCERGCPSCVMLSRRPDGNRNLSKAGALDLIARLHRHGSGNEWL